MSYPRRKPLSTIANGVGGANVRSHGCVLVSKKQSSRITPKKSMESLKDVRTPTKLTRQSPGKATTVSSSAGKRIRRKEAAFVPPSLGSMAASSPLKPKSSHVFVVPGKSSKSSQAATSVLISPVESTPPRSVTRRAPHSASKLTAGASATPDKELGNVGKELLVLGSGAVRVCEGTRTVRKVTTSSPVRSPRTAEFVGHAYKSVMMKKTGSPLRTSPVHRRMPMAPPSPPRKDPAFMAAVKLHAATKESPTPYSPLRSFRAPVVDDDGDMDLLVGDLRDADPIARELENGAFSIVGDEDLGRIPSQLTMTRETSFTTPDAVVPEARLAAGSRVGYSDMSPTKRA